MTRLFALLVLLLLPAIAFAQAITPAPSATDPLIITAVLVAISGAMAFLRSVAPAESWAHTKLGAIALTVAGAVLAAIYGAVQSHGLDGRAALIAVLGAIGSLVGVSNPSGKALAARGAALLLPFVFMLGACAGLTPLPQPTPAQYDAALVSCLENAGATNALPVGQKILNCFLQPGLTTQQYEQCAEQGAGTLAVDASSIVIQCAVDSWIDFNPAPAKASPKPALIAARNVRARHLRLLTQGGGR